MKRIESREAAEKLLAGDFKGTSDYNLFIYRFILDMENKHDLNIRISEAEKIYGFFRDIISYKLDPISDEQIGLYDESTSPGDGTDDKPQEDHPPYTPGAGKPPEDDPTQDRPNPVDNVLTGISHIKTCYNPDPMGVENIKRIGCDPYKGYVSDSNVEPEDVLWIEEGGEILPLPNGSRHFKKWSEEAKNNQSVPNFNIQMDEVEKAVAKRAKAIDFFMHDFDLSESEAETVYYYLTEKDADSKGKPLDKNTKDVLKHIKELTDIVNDL